MNAVGKTAASLWYIKKPSLLAQDFGKMLASKLLLI